MLLTPLVTAGNDPEWWIHAVMDLIPLLLWETSLGIGLLLQFQLCSHYGLLLQFKLCSHYVDVRSSVAVFEKLSTLHSGFAVWTEYLSIFCKVCCRGTLLTTASRVWGKCLSYVVKSVLMVQNSCQCSFNLRKLYSIILLKGQ